MSSQSFRAGVVIVIRRENGDLMAFERKDVPGSWQLPQGGIDIDEEPVDAAWRELAEETGFTSADVAMVLELPDYSQSNGKHHQGGSRIGYPHGKKSCGQHESKNDSP